jgi:hypothetical protein
MEPSTILGCFLQYLCWWTPSRLTQPCLRGFVGFHHLAGSFSSLRAFAFPPSPAGQASPAVNLLGEPHALANPLRSRADSLKHGLRLTGLEPGPPAQYLAKLTSLALHTVFPLRIPIYTQTSA